MRLSLCQDGTQEKAEDKGPKNSFQYGIKKEFLQKYIIGLKLRNLKKNLGNDGKCFIFAPQKAGCSSARFRVRVWGACGRKFESCHPD